MASKRLGQELSPFYKCPAELRLSKRQCQKQIWESESGMTLTANLHGLLFPKKTDCTRSKNLPLKIPPRTNSVMSDKVKQHCHATDPEWTLYFLSSSHNHCRSPSCNKENEIVHTGGIKIRTKRKMLPPPDWLGDCPRKPTELYRVAAELNASKLYALLPKGDSHLFSVVILPLDKPFQLTF